MKRSFQLLTALLLVSAFGIRLSTVSAQDVLVNANTTRSPLPPQALNYFEDPGRFFTVSLQNMSSETLNIFLGVQIEQINPADGVGLTTPIDLMPEQGITLPPNMTSPRTLSLLEMKNLFKHLSTKDIVLTGPSFSDYQSGTVGLLPEGHYCGKVTVYRLEYGSTNPQVLSNPLTGKCYFDICYSAAAPIITEPSSLMSNLISNPEINKEADFVSAGYSVFGQNDESLNAATLDKNSPLFIWREPQLTCSSQKYQYNYTLNLYKITPGQSPEEAIESHIVSYTKSNIMTPQYLIPSTAIPSLLALKSYFVAEVVAEPKVKDLNSEQYSTVENDGRSPFIVVRLGENGSTIPVVIDTGDGGQTVDDEDEDEEESVEEVVKYFLNPPKITSPKDDGSIWAMQLYKENKDSIVVEWTKPTIVSGPADFNGTDTLKYSYNIKAVEVKTGMSLQDIIDSKGFQETKNRTALKDTIHFKNIDKSLVPGSVIAVVVTANCTNEKDVKYDDTSDNVIKVSYLQFTNDEFAPCHPERDTIKNRELGVFNEKDLRMMRVQIGQFPLVLTKAILKEKKYYTGEGYVIWKPWGSTEVKIAVEFDSLFINSDKIVYKGNVRNMKEPVMEDIIPYGLFDRIGIGNFVDTNLKQYGPIVSSYLKDDSSIGQYYKYIQDGSRLIDLLCGEESGPVYLPIGLPKEIPSCPVDIQILNCEFSATTAWVNLFGMFKMPETAATNDQVAAFGLPHQCIGPESLIEDGDSLVLSLLSDINLNDKNSGGYVFKLKSPDDISTMDNGCWVSVGKDKAGRWGFKGCMLDIEMAIPDLLKDDGRGNVVKGQDPCARGTVYFHDWSDWVATFSMDPFQSEDAPGWTFVVGSGNGKTRGGLSYDHSVIKNPPSFTFPKGYNKQHDKVKTALAKGDTYWQGFYLSNMQVRFPKVFEVEGGDGNEDEAPEPGNAKPAYGRVAIGVEKFIIDDSGICFTFYGENLLSAKAGGWGITLDRADLTITQSKFSQTSIKGLFDVPLFDDDFAYKFSIINSDHAKDLKYVFEVTPNDKLNMDFWLAEVTLPEKLTHFSVESQADTTQVELVMGGDITINGTKDKDILGFKIPGVHFEGMRLANFAEKTGDGKSLKQGKNESNPKESKDSKGNVLYTYNNDAETFFFSTGAWSLASPEKSLGGLDFTLKDWGLKTNDKDMGLNVKGQINFVGEQFAAAAALTVWAEVDLDNLDIKYKTTTFEGIEVHSGFGGVTVDGSLTVYPNSDDMKAKGFKGSLKFALPGDLFTLEAEGQFVEQRMTQKEADAAGKEKDEDGNYPTYNSAYFLGKVGATIPMGPVSLKEIQGGFYFNTNVKKEPTYGTHGGMFGLGLASTDGGAIEGKMDMTVTYDAVNKRLSTFIMRGNLKAMKGIINADAMVRYHSFMTEAKDSLEREFQLSITLDATADSQEAFEKLLGDGTKFEIPQAIGDLKEMADKNENKTKDSKDDDGGSSLKASCGVSISLDFRIKEWYKVINKTVNGKTEYVIPDKSDKVRWHFYLGEPGTADQTEEQRLKKRCRITIIDFQLGGKDDPVACWGKLYANAYLCFGNELPGNGALPPIPDRVREFLDGKQSSGKNNSQRLEKERSSASKEFNPDQQTNNAPIKGGIMFGAAVGGEFGLNAVICYAQAEADAGFDLVLKQYDENAKCTNGSRMGDSRGFYGTGQVYAYIAGEMGLMINLWIFKGKIPLIEAGLGALLQGGFPNPSWFHGKARAKCKLLGGLIKFNSSLEIKAGNVCIPEFGNPLDDIKIFEDMTVGSSDKDEGWNVDNAVSCYETPAFTTNMVIGQELRLVDEKKRYEMADWDEDPGQYDKNAQRSYFFFLDPVVKMEIFDNLPTSDDAVPAIKRDISYRTTNNMSYTLLCGARMEQQKFYKVSMGGYCKELREGKLVDPVFNDEESNYKDVHRAWRQDTTYYFYTDKYSATLFEDVVLSEPRGNNSTAYKTELNQPKLHMKGERSADLANTDYEYTATLEVYNPIVNDWVFADLNVGPTLEWDSEAHAYVSVDEKGNEDRKSGYTYNKYGAIVDSVDWVYLNIEKGYKRILQDANDELNVHWRNNLIVPFSPDEAVEGAKWYTRATMGSLHETLPDDYYDRVAAAKASYAKNGIQLRGGTGGTGARYNWDKAILRSQNPPTNFGVAGVAEYSTENRRNYLVYCKQASLKVNTATFYHWQGFFDGIAEHFDLKTIEGFAQSAECAKVLISTCYPPENVTGGVDVNSLDEAHQLAVNPIFMSLNRIKYPVHVADPSKYTTRLDSLINVCKKELKKRGITYTSDTEKYKQICADLCMDNSDGPIPDMDIVMFGSKPFATSSDDSSSGTISVTPIHKVGSDSSSETSSGSGKTFVSSTTLNEYVKRTQTVVASVRSEALSGITSGSGLSATIVRTLENRVKTLYSLGEPTSMSDLYEKASAIYSSAYTNTSVSDKVKNTFYNLLVEIAEKAGVSSSGLKVPAKSSGSSGYTPETTTSTVTKKPVQINESVKLEGKTKATVTKDASALKKAASLTTTKSTGTTSAKSTGTTATKSTGTTVTKSTGTTTTKSSGTTTTNSTGTTTSKSSGTTTNSTSTTTASPLKKVKLRSEADVPEKEYAGYLCYVSVEDRGHGPSVPIPDDAEDPVEPETKTPVPETPTVPAPPFIDMGGKMAGKDMSASVVIAAAANLNNSAGFTNLQIGTAQEMQLGSSNMHVGNLQLSQSENMQAGNLQVSHISTGSSNMIENLSTSILDGSLGTIIENRGWSKGGIGIGGIGGSDKGPAITDHLGALGGNIDPIGGDYTDGPGIFGGSGSSAIDAINDMLGQTGHSFEQMATMDQSKEVVAEKNTEHDIKVATAQDQAASNAASQIGISDSGDIGDFFSSAYQPPEPVAYAGTQYGYNPPLSDKHTSSVDQMPVKENMNGASLTDDDDFYYWYVDKDLSKLKFDKNSRYRLTFKRTDKTKMEAMLNELKESYKQVSSDVTTKNTNVYGNQKQGQAVDSTNINSMMQAYYNQVLYEIGGDSAEVLQRKFAEAKKNSQYETEVYQINDFYVGEKSSFAQNGGLIYEGKYGTVLKSVKYACDENISDYSFIPDWTDVYKTLGITDKGSAVFRWDRTEYNKKKDEILNMVNPALFTDPYYCLAYITGYIFCGGINLKGSNYCSSAGYSPAATVKYTFGDSKLRDNFIGNGIYSSGNGITFQSRRNDMKANNTHQSKSSHRFVESIITDIETNYYENHYIASRFNFTYNDVSLLAGLIESLREDFCSFIYDCNCSFSSWETMMESNATRGDEDSALEYELYHIPVIYGLSTGKEKDNSLPDAYIRNRSSVMGQLAWDVFMKILERSRSLTEAPYTDTRSSTRMAYQNYWTSYDIQQVRYNGFHTRTSGTLPDGSLYGFDVRPDTDYWNVVTKTVKNE